MATTLRYPYEVRAAKEYFDDIPDLKVEPDMLKLAERILRSKSTDFDTSRFVDRYEEAVVEMLKKKQAGLPVSRERAAPRPQNVANLMDALRRSIAEEKASSTPPKKGRKRIEGSALEFQTKDSHSSVRMPGIFARKTPPTQLRGRTMERRRAGRCRSACIRARWNRRPPRVRA